MVNRGDGGARRPAPPPGRPAPKARPVDEDNEKTNAINLADMNLDDLDEAPVPAASAPSRGAPAKPSPPTKKLGSKSFDEEDNEKTNAINLADVNLDDLDEMPAPRPAAPAARPQPGRAAPAPQPAPRPAPAPAARPQPGRPAPRQLADDERTGAVSHEEVERAMAAPPKRPAPPPADEGEEKTSAISMDEIDASAALERARAKLAAAKAGATSPRPTASPAPAPRPAAPAPRVEEPPTYEKTMAVSMDDIEAKKPALLAKLKAGKEPAAADRTYLVDEEEAPVVKAPPAKKFGVAPKPEAPAAPAGGGDGEPKLVVRGGPDVGKTFPLSKDLTLIGRGLDADVVINDASASRKHFNIVRTLSGWKLVDLGSGNGTRVDGNRVTEIALKQGMRIEAGGTTLEWVHDAGGGSAAAAGKADAKADDDGGKPSRRVAEAAPERKRDASKLDKFDDKDDKPKGGGKLPPPSEEKTTFGDIQALEIDPEWEARRLKQRREGVAEAPAAGGSNDTTEVEAEEEVVEKKGGAGKKIAIAGIIVAVLGGGFVAADKFAGLGIIFPKEVKVATPEPDNKPGDGDKKPDDDKVAGDDKNGETDKKPEDGDKKPEDGDKKPEDGDKKPEAGGKEAAKAKVDEAGKAGKEGRWLAARALYAAALEADDLVDGGDSGLAQADNEIQARGAIVAGLKLVNEAKWADAVKSLGEVKEASSAYKQAQELLAIAKDGIVAEQLAKANELLGKKDLEGAKAAIAEVLKTTGPEYAEGAALKEAIERAAAPDADLTELDPSDPNAKNPPKAAPSDLKPGLDAYSKGDFQAVVNAFDGIVFGGTASRADVARAKAWSGAALAFDEAMKQVAATAGKPEEQLGYLRSALRADAIIGGAQKAKVVTELAKVWGALAKKALETDKNPGLAGLYAKLALAFDPAQADAKAVQDEAVKQAKAGVAEAKGLKDDPDKALALFVAALQALPTADPDYAEADKAATALVKPAE